MERESMAFDVVIVGAGPSGLSAAIQYAQLCQNANKPVSVCVLEKGSDIGAHIISGAVIETKALDELLPNWSKMGAPIQTQVTEDHFKWLSVKQAYSLPVPPLMNNEGNYIISLGKLCRWLADHAQALGVEVFPGFAANELIFGDQGEVQGVITKDMGLDKAGQPKSSFEPGVELRAKQTLIGEGCRGYLAKQLVQHYQLDKQACPQTYGIGFKEVWKIEDKHHRLGQVLHTIGWPLDNQTYGGSFCYHWEDQKLSIGFVIGLDYKNPYLNPFLEFQRFKHHPLIAPMLENGQCLSYGARALNEGGLQSLPTLTFPGGALIGCSAGFLNVAKIKGSHTAMKSGMLAAQEIFKAIEDSSSGPLEVTSYSKAVKNSWIHTELHQVRNIRPSFRWGLWGGLAYSALDQFVLRGKAPWTFKHVPDHKQLKPAKAVKPIVYPKPDGKISFDRLNALSRANVFHEENQQCHLVLKEAQIPILVNYSVYDAPEQRYCPAGVYEIVQNQQGDPQLQINAQNCIHCKTCDIKDPKQNIEWVPPEGSGGPNYSEM